MVSIQFIVKQNIAYPVSTICVAPFLVSTCRVRSYSKQLSIYGKPMLLLERLMGAGDNSCSFYLFIYISKMQGGEHFSLFLSFCFASTEILILHTIWIGKWPYNWHQAHLTHDEYRQLFVWTIKLPTALHCCQYILRLKWVGKIKIIFP